MKKALAILLVAVIVFVIFTTTEPQKIKEESENKTSRAVSVIVPIGGQRDREIWEEIQKDAESEEIPFEVKLECIPEEKYWESVYQRYSQQTMPDVMLLSDNMIPAFQELGVLKDLTQLVEENNYREQFWPKLLNNVTENSQTYGIPFSCYTYGLYYNKTLFEKYGLTAPKDWDELWNVCEKLVREPADAIGLAASPGEELTNQFLQFLYLNDATVRSLKSENSVETYQLFADMVAERMISRDCVIWTAEDLTKKFASREVAMMVNNSSQYPLLKAQDPSFEWDVVKIPGSNYGNTLFSANSLTITKKEDTTVAEEFVEFVSSKEQVGNRLLMQGSISPRTDVDNKQITHSGEASVFYDMFRYANSIPSHVLWQNISSSMQESIMEIFSGETNVEQVAQNVDNVVNIYIIDGKYRK